MKQSLIKFIKSPAFSVLLLIIASAAIILSTTIRNHNDIPGGRTIPAIIESTSSEISEPKTSISTTTSSAITTTVSNITTTTSSATTSDEITNITEVSETVSDEPIENTDPVSTPQYIAAPSNYAGESPNSSFYQDRLAIAGDSIAFGFNLYGYIPDEHNIARESVSMWNLDYFTFNYGYGDVGLVEAVEYVHPKLLYMSLGMNDVNMNSAETYALRYEDTIRQILGRIPDINIVVAGITPVSGDSSFTSNDTIRQYNAALEQAVKNINSSHVYYFDAYSVISDEYGNLRYDCSAGDGIHLATHCYNDFLVALFNFLDTTPVKEQIEASE